jgi:polysaccharide pyruvyl transferase WcaK-like protein
MDKYIFIGGAGAPNFGDELIIHGWKNFLKNNNTKGVFIFFENIEKNSTKMHSEKNSDQEFLFKDDLAKIAKFVTDKDFWFQIIRGFSFFENHGDKIYSNIDFSIFENTKIIHLHGGGYLNEFDPTKGFYIGFAAALKKKYNIKKVVATGIGFGPFANYPTKITNTLTEILSHFDLFELRDKHGFHFLRDTFKLNCIRLGLDDCFLLGTKQIFKDNLQSPTKKTLYLSFIDYNVRSFHTEFWNSLQEFSHSFDDIVFFESYPWEDQKVISYIKNLIPQIKTLKVEDALKGFPASRNDFVISSRFHVHFIFARLGCRGFFLKDSKYYSIKHNSIIELGSSFQYLSGISTKIPDIAHPNENQISLSDFEESNMKFKEIIANYIYNR